MGLPFAESERSTLGIEWELALVDRQTGDLRSVAERILEATRAEHPELSGEDEHPYVKQELLLNTVELVTDVCHSVEEGVEQLRETARNVMKHCEPLDVDLYCQGSHPFAPPTKQPVTDKERYNELIERTQWWGRQMVIYGIHVHVGLEDVKYAMPVVNALCNYNAHFQALSASSPYWSGENTGYASNRALMFQQLPTAGQSYQFEEWSGYEKAVADLEHTGVIRDVTEVRWDVRAVPRLGTVELRICDGVATLEEIGAITALSQCLVEDTVRHLENGGSVTSMPPWYVKENKWRAARYGMDAIIILNEQGDEELVTEHLAKELQRLEPLAQELGCAKELAHLETMMDKGTGYQRQRRVAETHDGDLRQVVLDSAARTRTSING
ncbi:glutamate--cysteine ligase [Nesterenkonia alkaliphila]|uniref:Putative glutamate--cysteine ligase 2 n=1 Tax=Nesterenkonia alkaliphila TaxID=1463631 RepID=A0A7K1UGR8_9MICC|nr:glutamate--cysteine ligase [Nesterenkonia alkaliphila]MVT25594.1 glutamate--cysteine ligase [Nesterenkonia alkaliphila]GFZ77552.1 putative glutamate--cysteine ligase 2 [Nesterenkonia alkaliphila]